jgi:hypothetical protein
LQIKLSADEQVTWVEGTIGRFRDVDEPVITSLTFRTNAGKTYGLLEMAKIGDTHKHESE